MLASSSDYLLRGSVQGLLLEAVFALVAILIARYCDSSAAGISVALAAAVLSGMTTLLLQPIAYLTVWKSRRSPFVLDEDIRATISGRLVGLALGLGFGTTLATWF